MNTDYSVDREDAARAILFLRQLCNAASEDLDGTDNSVYTTEMKLLNLLGTTLRVGYTLTEHDDFSILNAFFDMLSIFSHEALLPILERYKNAR